MSRNFSPYSLSLKSRLTLLFEIYKGFDRSARLAWKFKLGKNITRHYLSKGFTMLFLLTVIAIFIVNELPGKMFRYQVIIFYAINKASESFVSLVVRMLLLSSRKFTNIKIPVTQDL